MKKTLIILIMCLSLSGFAQETVITSPRDFSEIEKVQEMDTTKITIPDENLELITETLSNLFIELQKSKTNIKAKQMLIKDILDIYNEYLSDLIVEVEFLKPKEK
jgi:hypothetical protein